MGAACLCTALSAQVRTELLLEKGGNSPGKITRSQFRLRMTTAVGNQSLSLTTGLFTVLLVPKMTSRMWQSRRMDKRRRWNMPAGQADFLLWE